MGAVNAHKHRHRLIADGGLALRCQTRNKSRCIRSLAYLRLQPIRLFGLAGFAKEIIDILNPRSRCNPLIAHSSVLLSEIVEEFFFQVVSGRKIRVPAFARKRMVASSIPIKTCNSKPGSR